jgi:hypothetical protein
MNRFGGVLAGVVAFFAIGAAAGFHATPYDNFVLLADAFRHGRVWIDWPGAYIDALRYNGRYYVIEAPLPAVLLLPAVMLNGTAVNQSTLAAILGGVATCAGWEISRILGAGLYARIALCGFLLLGTDLFFCATFGDVWFIAHVASVAFTLLALWELIGRRRGWLVALLGACAFHDVTGAAGLCRARRIRNGFGRRAPYSGERPATRARVLRTDARAVRRAVGRV